MKELVVSVAAAALLLAPAGARAAPDCNGLKARFDEYHERIWECVIDRAATADDDRFSFVLASAGVAVAVGAVVAFVLLRRGAEIPTPYEDLAELDEEAVEPVS